MCVCVCGWGGGENWGVGAFLLDFSYRQLSTPPLLHTWMLPARSMAVSHHTIQAKFSRSLEPRSVKRRGVLRAGEGLEWGWGWGGFCLISLTGSYTLLLCEARGSVKQRPNHHHHTIIIKIIQASSAQLHKCGDRELSAVGVLLGCRQSCVYAPRSLKHVDARQTTGTSSSTAQHYTTSDASSHSQSSNTDPASFFLSSNRQTDISCFLPSSLPSFLFSFLFFFLFFFFFFFLSLCVCVFSLSNFTQ